MATIEMTGTRHGAVAAAQPGLSLQRAGGIAALLAAFTTLAALVPKTRSLLDSLRTAAHPFSSRSTLTPTADAGRTERLVRR